MAEVKGGARRGRRVVLSLLVLAPFLASATSGGAAEETEEDAPPVLSEKVKVEVVAPDGVIDDLRGGRAMVVVRNTAATPVRVTGFHVAVDDAYGEVELLPLDATGCAAETGAEPVADDPEALTLPCAIDGNHQALIPVAVTVTQLLRTGKANAVFDVTLEQNGIVGNVIATHALSFGVFGETELLPLLEIPSILVLPGVLALVILTMLWRWGVRPLASSKDSFPVAADGLEFWFASVAASAGFLVLWRLAYGRNLLAGYGYRDFAGLLFAALVCSLLVAYVLLVHRRYDSAVAKLREAQRIKPGDTAEKALEKLSLRDKDSPLNLPVAHHGRWELLIYERGSEEKPHVLAPPLEYDLDGADAQSETNLSTLLAGNSVAPVAAALLGLVTDKKASVEWLGDRIPVEVKDDETRQQARHAPAIAPKPETD